MTMKTSRPASFIKGSLGFRLAGLFSLIFLLLLAGFAYYTAQTQSRLINQRLEAHATALARTLAAALETPVATASSGRLESALLALSGTPGLHQVEVRSPTGEPIARLAQTSGGRWHTLIGTAGDAAGSAPARHVDADMLFAQANIGSASPLGSVRLAFDRSAARHTDRVVRRDALIGGAMMVLVIVATVLAALRRPMADVASAAAFARGLTSGRQAPLEVSGTAPELATLAHDLNDAADSLERSRRALAYSERHYRELVENLAEPVFETDSGFLVSYVNPPWSAVVGRSTGETLGKPLTDFIASDPPTEFMQALDTLQRGGADADALTLHGLHPRARQGWLDLKMSPRFDENNRLTGFSGAISDVGVHKDTERRLLSSIHAAEAANRTKNAFLANISHEIRTPMNAIIGMTDLVLDSQLSAEQREYLGLARNASEALLGIINNILDFSRIESGQVDFEQIPFSVRACVELAIDSVAESAQAKDLKLSSQVDPMVPDALIGDPHRFRQVIVNLVGNAIKFTDRGFVSLRVARQAQEDGEVVLQVVVRDSGIGIAPEQLERIFDPFSQADDSVTRRFGGTGLGLTISSELVARMHGSIEVSSKPAEGSLFTFTARMPIAQPPARSDALDWTLEGMPALIVTGGERQNCPLCELLDSWQMKSHQVDSGEAALETLTEAATAGHAYPLVVLGDSPGSQDVFELAERVQQDPLIRPQVMILIAGAGQRGDAARCRAIGIAAYLTRPFEPADVFNAILQSFAPHPDGALITRHSLRERQRNLHVLVAEDDPQMRAMTVELLERLGHSAHGVATGREAVDASAAARFDLILMDTQRAATKGLEATALIRKREVHEGHHTPIIALVGESRAEDGEACLAAGMNGHVGKPLRAAEFAAMLDAVANGSITGTREVTGTAGHSEGQRTFARDEAIEYLGGDTELLAELATMYLETEEQSRQKLRQSISVGDYAAAYATVSTIKGSVGSFAAGPALGAANRVERLCREGGGPLLEDALRGLEQELNRLADALRIEIGNDPDAPPDD